MDDLTTMSDADLLARAIALADEQERIKAERRRVRDETIRRDELARAPKPPAATDEPAPGESSNG